MTTFAASPNDDASGFGDSGVDDLYDDFWKEFAKGATPSYEYYEEMASEEMPGYKVELAKSGRSQCDACKKKKGTAKKNAPAKSQTELEDQQQSTASSNTESALVTTSGPRRSTRAKKKPTSALTTVGGSASSKVADNQNFIPEGAVRLGSLDNKSGSYGRWHHLKCWRVPYRIWGGMTDLTDAKSVKQDLFLLEEILLTGISQLPEDDLDLLVEHIMDSNNHAAKRKVKKAVPNLEKLRRAAEAAKAAAREKMAMEEKEEDANPAAMTNEGTEEEMKPAAKPSGSKKRKKSEEPDVELPSASASKKSPKTTSSGAPGGSAGTATALTVKDPNKKAKFVIPRPGVNGAEAGCYEGKRFVLTGVFPEVGGGAGLNLGKDRVKAMIEDFGGKVTGSISGKTNFLVVGREPGQSKVGKAKGKGIPMVDVKALNDRIMGGLPALEQAETPAIKSWSAGYQVQRIGYADW